jgi:hypothetical protein
MKALFLSLIMLYSISALNQKSSFSISLEPLEIENLGGVQSYAVGQSEGKWLIIGGRLDGLHRRQPWATFDLAGHNTQIFVVDPVAKKQWSAPLTSLSVSLQEQLKSTNTAFYQSGNTLYLLGGYGYSDTEGRHTTFANLTAVDVPATIEAIIHQKDLSKYFRQISNPLFQVTGGRLEKIYDTYYLVGGQKFIGRYNPMGPRHGPGFIQEYTNQIRKFRIEDDGHALAIDHIGSITDSAQLHRRDFNVCPQILPNGEEGLTALSGVFQYEADLPWLNTVNIDSSSYAVNKNFKQYYNHYHCATLTLYSEKQNEMNTLFFGGMAQYYDSSGIRIKDDNVPFVKTIAKVSRDKNGLMSEEKLPVEMPGFLGASAEFIPLDGLPEYPNSVIKLDQLKKGRILIGYIYGGINSPHDNIFWINNGTQSEAENRIFRVYLEK